jgi:hypothetical protein
MINAISFQTIYFVWFILAHASQRCDQGSLQSIGPPRSNSLGTLAPVNIHALDGSFGRASASLMGLFTPETLQWLLKNYLCCGDMLTPAEHESPCMQCHSSALLASATLRASVELSTE